MFRQRFCVVPVCDQSLVPLRSTVKVTISAHVCKTAAGVAHHLQGAGIQLPRHLQAKKLLHFPERVFKGVQRAAPDAVGGTDTYIGEKLRQILLEKTKQNRNKQTVHV